MGPWLAVDGYVAGLALELEHKVGPASFQNHKVFGGMAIARATVTNLVILRLSALAFEDPGVLLALALAWLRRRHSQPAERTFTA